MTNRLFRTLAGAALAVAVAAAPAFAEDITIKHAQGEATVSVPPAKVATFDLATLDTLDALGIDIVGLPGTNLPEYLKKYGADSYAKLGSLFEPDYEAVNALAPDLIVIGGRSAATYPEISKIAPTVDLSNDWTRFEASIKENSQIVGQIFGKTAEIDAMIATLDEKIAAAKAEAANEGTALVLLTNGAEVTNFGPGSRFGWIFETIGMKPAVQGVEAATHGDVVSFEFILETNPDWLFVIDRDAATGSGSSAAILDNELVRQTNAWKNGKVVYVDPVRSYVVNGGLPAFTQLVDQVGTALAAK
ncbi:MAG TPA: siderophore ABC transporter substrate-binding protein [Devosia sp.]|nr:siderophore ABC transporter substrate-binding protein [Devosia sp.]